MKYDPEEQLRRADIIVDEICKVGNVSYCDFLFKKKSLKMNIVRGVAFYLSWEYGVHARMMALHAHRSRANIINQSKRYRYYINSGDPISLQFYQQTKKNIESRIKKYKSL